MERSENIVNTLSELITKEMEQAFTAAGYDAKFGPPFRWRAMMRRLAG